MLERRIFSAALAGSASLALMLWAPLPLLTAVAAAVMLLAGWEWARLAGLQSRWSRCNYLILALLIGSVWLTALFHGMAIPVMGMLLVAVGWWVVAAVCLPWWQPMVRDPGARLGWLALGLLLLPVLLLALVWIASWPEPARWLLVYAVCLVWVADIGAYFAGRRFGRTALAPRISAGKTREGLVGGLVAVFAYAIIAGWLLDLTSYALVLWVVLALLAGGLSVVGDLTESVLKREAGMKDSGTIMPGHGGLLDRIDSLLAALPVLALGMHVLLEPGGLV